MLSPPKESARARAPSSAEAPAADAHGTGAAESDSEPIRVHGAQAGTGESSWAEAVEVGFSEAHGAIGPERADTSRLTDRADTSSLTNEGRPDCPGEGERSGTPLEQEL